MRTLIGLGSRPYILSALVVSIVVATEQCGQEPCGEDLCFGAGGAGGDGGTGGDAGQGGEGEVGGLVVTGGAGAGGQGGDGGTGGATTTSETGGGGSGGEGGAPCVPTFACGPKDCGMVDDGCGKMLNCDATLGDPVTCGAQSGGNDGPMTCGADHLCHCPPEGNSPAAMALCEGAQSPGVGTWCAENGGCDTAYCGTPPVAKKPDNCKYGGGLSDVEQIWCCIKQP